MARELATSRGAERTAEEAAVSYVPEDEADELIDKHISRWATLLDRLK